MNITVRNWLRYQAKFDTKRPGDFWKKIYKSLFTDYEFCKLTEREKLLLIAVYVFTDLESGTLSMSDKEFKHYTMLKFIDTSNLDHFMYTTETECDHDANTVCAQCDHNAITQVARKEKKRVDIEKKRVDRVLNANLDTSFNIFWDLYPDIKSRKCNPEKCRSKFKAICRGGTDPDDIIKGLKAAIASPIWKEDGGKYIPGSHPFLNQERWKAHHGELDESATHTAKTKGSL
jgi:hypothetical protein